MTIKFFKTNSDKRQITKILDDVNTLTGDIKQDTSILEPKIYVCFDVETIKANYCYIQEFNRYYFIKNIDVTKNMLVIDLVVDVLMSFKNEIKQMVCNIVKQEKTPFSNIIDNDVTIKNNNIIEVVEFSTSCLNLTTADNNSNNFIMTIAGG